MFGSLRKKFEEVLADVNPFDNGKTASTVRAARKQPVAPVQTVRQPTNKPPSYGGGIGGFVNRTRDVFDANTPQDNWKREQAAKQWKAPLQAPKPVDARGILSRVYDQANIFDNNRTFEQSTPTNQKSAFQQGGQFTGQLGRGVVGGTTRVANTIGAQGAQAIATGQMLMAQATGNEEAFRNANATAQAADENFKRGEGGILNTGTLYNADEARKGEFTTGAKRIGGGIAESGLEVGSMGLGGFTGKQVVKQGLKQGVKSQLPVIAKNAVLNTAQGGVMAANQGAKGGDIAKAAALGGVLGTAGDVGLGLAGAGIAKAATKIPTTNLAPTVKSNLTKLATDEGGFVQPGRTPKRIHPEDQNVMADFIDMQRGVYKPDPETAYNLELDASRIAERYGLPMPNTAPKLANVFDKRLQEEGYGKLAPPDGEVEQRLMLDYMKNPSRPAPSTSLVGEGAQAPLQMSPSRRQQLMDNMRKLAGDERGSIQLPGKKSDPLEALKAEARKYTNSRDFYESLRPTERDLIRKLYPTKTDDARFEFFMQRDAGMKTTGELKNTPKPDTEYGMAHRPSQTGATLDDISKKGEVMPQDVYSNPEYYADMQQPSYRESYAAILNAKDKPNAFVTVYRASPRNQFNEGDWVTLSKTYAKEHAEAQGGKVHSKRVKASDIQFAGDDINEFGYFPTAKNKPSIWKDQAGAIGRNIRDEGAEAGKTGKKLTSIEKENIQKGLDKFYGEGGDQQFMTGLIKKYESQLNGKNSVLELMNKAERKRYDSIANPTPVAQTPKTQFESDLEQAGVKPEGFTKGEKVGFAGILSPSSKARTGTFVRQVDEHLAEIDYGDHTETNHVNNLYKMEQTAPQSTKPEGFILKETKGRGGRKDTIRVKKGADGKLEKTYQTEFDTKSADPYIKEYADSLKQMESGLRGGDMIPDGEGGYKRTSEHSNFYREHFKQTGRKPTRADWYAEAERQVKAGTADKDFMEYYNAKITERGTAPDNAKVLENKAPRRMSEQEWASLTKQAGLEAPKSKGAVNSATESLKKEQLNAVSQGDFKRAQEIRTKIGEVEQGLKRTPPDLSKRAEEITPDLEVKDIKGRSNKEVKKQYMQRANDYLGERRAAEFKAVDEARRFNQQFPDLTDTQRLEVIRAADQPSYKSSDPQVQAAVEYLHTNYDSLYNYFTGERGVNMGYQHSYYPRMYKNPTTGEPVSGAEFELLQRGSARQKGRTADIVNEDYLITKDPAEALQMYVSNLENAAAGKKFLSDLEKDGLVVRSTEPVRGMRPVVAEGMQESGTIFYAKPEVAKSLDRMFGTQEASGMFEKIVEKAQGLNSFFQSVVLSGGAPNTPINAFGIMQVMKETMAGHPVIAGKAFFKSMGRKNTDEFFKANSNTIKEMVENGYDLRIDYNANYRNMFQRIAETGREKGKLAGLNEAWDQFTNDATFQRFMPMLEVLHYKQIRKGLIRRGASPEVAAKRAMDATSNFFGKTQMAKQASRSKVGQDFVGATLFAPRFRESMINFWGRNVVALNPKNLGKAEYRANQMFMVTAAATWAAMEGANKALNGNWMHDNPDGKKDKLIVPDKFVPFNTNGKDVAVPFLSSVATVPRNAAMGAYNLATGKFSEAGKNLASFASMPFKTAGELLINKDHFDNTIVDEDSTSKQKFTQAGAYIAKNNTQPWLREAANVIGQNLPDDVKKSLGIKKKSPFEAISNALEVPTRFYDSEHYRYDNGWTPRGAPGEKFTITEQRQRAAVKKEMDNIPNKVGLSKKQKEAYEALITVDFDDEGNLKTDNDPFYRAKRATQLQDDGVFEAMKQRAQYNKKLKGQPIDPLFNLPADARRVMLWKQTLPAGTKDPTIAKIYDQEWYQDFRGEQDKYYREKQVWNKKMGYKSTKDKHPYPQPSKQLQAKLDYYYTLPKGTGARSAMLRANPDILKHWDRTEAWTNGERAMVGLGPLEEQTGFGSYASSGSGRSYSRSGRSGGSRGGRGGRRAANFDYTKNLFDSSRGGSKATTASLRRILEEAMSDFKTKA